MFAGQHNQIHATTPCTAWVRAAHLFFTFGSPPSIFFSKKKLAGTPKRFHLIGFCRDGHTKGNAFASVARYDNCVVTPVLADISGRPFTQAQTSLRPTITSTQRATVTLPLDSFISITLLRDFRRSSTYF